MHTGDERSALGDQYRAAFAEAVELYVLSAYLTEWDAELALSPTCKRFRFIIGKDFGITRKDTCREVLQWLPADRQSDFLVAEEISGFHPKAVIWRTAKGRTFMLIGSSNLSRAAVDGNVEANVMLEVSVQQFEEACTWIDRIEAKSAPVGDGWLDRYVEAARQPKGGSAKRKPVNKDGGADISFKLPRPAGAAALLRTRRAVLKTYAEGRHALLQLFQRAAAKQITSQRFFTELPEHWSQEVGNRMQGKGWDRLGKQANFQDLARSFVAIVESPKRDRDDVVRAELDRLDARENPARKAFLSEMLCLRFPDEYPVLNKPVRQFLRKNRFTPTRGSSEGDWYIYVARQLRAALRANPAYPAKNLAELDTLIWASAEYNPRD
ncbi:hypothetical protein HY57_02080 [Dyella japonica A8]|uniref:Phospholipase D-like domain-containing protein n=1 Tax=Dyella japonica A8 TaxID=1217721 RepID=A0A075JVK8_9GAMM|nr:hypothetical protein HY57_02080 [Dyella japonica A8]